MKAREANIRVRGEKELIASFLHLICLVVPFSEKDESNKVRNSTVLLFCCILDIEMMGSRRVQAKNSESELKDGNFKTQWDFNLTIIIFLIQKNSQFLLIYFYKNFQQYFKHN